MGGIVGELARPEVFIECCLIAHRGCKARKVVASRLSPVPLESRVA